ncbi:GatB/YqeY domain-containing protein [Clostridium botulinum]|uniref:Aspartyl-tRNA amidotransferase n=1 Tax=Clostridium botulinum C/D str. DC5 TaxID=1443128 RepID=A0A0A0IC14_CLOBO|nr:GatB/YqeY domain-containing protein [Clostridium botulinum]KEI00966.1 aspartyl-tRNA amidotransferase [Clostridium botulinum C/D str. BKT75002]KEI11132.1 aspartyl-tRNA amidotransferase [Clostridium botulinum C/D str. BKT2873]KGM94056.1 aspartyl-tRNA amidotransferase [Clostridium botulinum D str. CCUG 7971]KGM98994.1 aspartyl-tRNA amidotransferase [Clostridium botulinum C/D str. DC5]KOC55231.1 aspartyl-tRNA amidotransferase [Clostridium botulinum]
MSLKEKLQQDWKVAMKNRDKFRSSTLSMAKAAILQVEKTDNRVLDDEEIIGILSKEVKSRRDALVDFENGNRQDLVDEAKSEIEILLEYLPKQLTEDEIAEIVRQIICETGASSAKDMGKVMSAAMVKLKGRADGKLVSSIVKQNLN